MDKSLKKLNILIVRRGEKNKIKRPSDTFHKISAGVSNKVGSPLAFCLALFVVAAWAITGPLFNFSDTWQLFINTGTTIVTFLMVFVIQNSQNRDGKAIQLKLDELISATKGARDEFVDIEELSDAELAELQVHFKEIHEHIKNKKPRVSS